MNPTDPEHVVERVQAPADYDELKQIRDNYVQLTETLSPYAEDIRSFVTDEDERNFLREARKAYVTQKESRKPQIDPSLQPVVERFESQLTPLVEYVNNEKKTREESVRATETAAQNANVEYGRRLLAERPDLGEDDGAGIGMLAAYAFNRKISLEEAWKRKGNTLAAPPKAASPPRSLRGDAATPGVPGESKEPPIKSARDLTRRLANNLRAGGMRG